MNEKMGVLMVGPLAKSGGVAIHTEYLVRALGDLNLPVILYNSSFGGEIPKIIINVIKIHRRTFGMFYISIKKRKSFNIIHIQASGGLPGFLNAITGVFVSSILRKKLIVTFHHSDTRKFVETHKKIVGIVVNMAKSFILVSNQQKKVFNNAFKDVNTIHVIPNGYDPILFRPINTSSVRKELDLPTDRRILVNIANLEEYKGQKYLIQAMKDVLATRDDVMLYIVGQGSLKSRLQSLIDKHSLHNNVILAEGNKPREEIPLWMNACDLFVLPSLSESFGIVQVEAMACGKPIVATRNGGSEEIIINDLLGTLVKPKDIDGLTRSILQALETEWDTEYIREHAQQFMWDNIADKVLNVYREVLKSHENSF